MDAQRPVPSPELPDPATYPEPYYTQTVVISEHPAPGASGIRVRHRVWKKQVGLEPSGRPFYQWVEVSEPDELGSVNGRGKRRDPR